MVIISSSVRNCTILGYGDDYRSLPVLFTDHGWKRGAQGGNHVTNNRDGLAALQSVRVKARRHLCEARQPISTSFGEICRCITLPRRILAPLPGLKKS